MVKRGRKKGGKIINCPSCGARVVVYVDTEKVCKTCNRTITVDEVNDRRLNPSLGGIR